MKKFLAALISALFLTPAFADEPTQKIQNENSYLGINLEKQPTQENGKQLIKNKKSFLFVNIIINGKCKENKHEG